MDTVLTFTADKYTTESGMHILPQAGIQSTGRKWSVLLPNALMTQAPRVDTE